MNNEGRLYTQVAAQAGVAPEKAQIACYLLQLSQGGKTMEQACALSRMERYTVRDAARDWGIPFPDYQGGKPLELRWVKPGRGEWTLTLGGEVVARVLSQTVKGLRSYKASWERGNASLVEQGSSALIAARRLSREIDRRSIALLGVDDLHITFDGERLAPEIATNAQKMQQALAA